ncbi:hypothetical protein [Burkholderia ubonensis]|uniref:hypothetical protein n=1 Tax=Burkholderia ubonensis TaxID=101571 RepID=UPI0012FCAF52|nr:hypothetical protein [Burkholderia ubonensis]
MAPTHSEIDIVGARVTRSQSTYVKILENFAKQGTRSQGAALLQGDHPRLSAPIEF